MGYKLVNYTSVTQNFNQDGTPTSYNVQYYGGIKNNTTNEIVNLSGRDISVITEPSNLSWCSIKLNTIDNTAISITVTCTGENENRHNNTAKMYLKDTTNNIISSQYMYIKQYGIYNIDTAYMHNSYYKPRIVIQLTYEDNTTYATITFDYNHIDYPYIRKHYTYIEQNEFINNNITTNCYIRFDGESVITLESKETGKNKHIILECSDFNVFYEADPEEDIFTALYEPALTNKGYTEIVVQCSNGYNKTYGTISTAGNFYTEYIGIDPGGAEQGISILNYSETGNGASTDFIFDLYLE